ncbi:carbohydrate ABC transporter permease [cyanobiont of Ornithocercus magnificus]|nr:carbohydrate ABC transporter permease [cyanobiont of Ornithocercus magnificus]
MKRSRSIWITLLLIWSLGPLLWQLYTSFTSTSDLVNSSLKTSVSWTLANYRQVLTTDPPFWYYLLNSCIVGVLSTLLTLIIAIPAGYALARVRGSLATFTRLSLLGITLFPYVLLFLALLEIARRFQLGNSLVALSLPYAGLSMPLAVLLLAEAFRDISIDLEDAARIEGLGLWQRLRWVLLPLIRPALGSTAILVFLFAWNEYPIALTWLSQDNLLTVPIAIARIAGSSIYTVPYGAYAASTVLSSTPLIVLVLVFQRQLVSGLTGGAVKE